MDKHFLTDIEIEIFKCFDHFKASGFKWVNLIGGKNNIGKTAFMEACYINVHSKSINAIVKAIHGIKFMRENLNTLSNGRKEAEEYLEATRCYTSKSNVGKKEFFITEKDAIKEYTFKINGKITTINSKDFTVILENPNNTEFIDNFGWSDYQIIYAYKSIQTQDKEEVLNTIIRNFDSSIENFKIIGDKPQCKTNGKYQDITEFGDGLRHYISIICALYQCKDGYLFIDEIDNGIYYTELDRLWEIILTVSKETNCQVFATTHSKEMIDSFARVSEKLEEQDITFTTIIKNREGKLKALTEDYEMLSYSLSQGHEVR